MKIGQALRNCDFFGTNVGMHFGRRVSREKGRSLLFTTEIGGLFTIACCIFSTIFCA